MTVSFRADSLMRSMQRNLSTTGSSLSNISERLSSGVRINSASDDAASLSLSKKITSKASGLSVANKNIQTGVAALSTYDNNLASMTASLHRMREMAVQAANGAYSDSERVALNSNAQELSSEIKRTMSINNNDTISGGKNDFIEKVDQLSEAQITASYTEDQIIRSADEFVSKISANASGSFILAGNINMGELGTLDKAAVTTEFTGELNGNGYALDGLKIDVTDGSAAGIFTRINGGKIKNLAIKNVDIKSNAGTAGALAGTGVGGTAEVHNTFSTGKISAGGGSTGGLVGITTIGSFSKSFADVDVEVTSGSLVGGFVGGGHSFNISECYSLGDVKNNTSAGSDYTGGFIGWASAGGYNITKSFATGNVTSSGGTIGGFAGTAGNAGGDISECYATGDVSAASDSGGFVGLTSEATITDSYATGNVAATGSGGGGFVGNAYASSTIRRSYSTGSASAGSNVGGFAGTGGSGGSVDASNFWDTEKSGNATSGGTAVGLTSAEIFSGTDAAGGLGSAWDLSYGAAQIGNVVHKQQTLDIQSSADGDAVSSYTTNNMNLDLNFEVNLSSKDAAKKSIEVVDNLLNYVSDKRADAGANMSVLEGVMQNNGARQDHLASSNSNIVDTDMAKEAASMVKNQIMQQSVVSLMQQAQSINADLLLDLY